MNHLYRLLVCGCVAAVLTVAFVFLLTRLGGAPLQDSLDLMVWLQKWGDELHRRDELQTRSGPVFRRTVEKNRIVHELIAHQLTLREAADQFRELEEEVRQAQPDGPDALPMNSDDEEMYRNVIVWVRSELAAKPDEAEKVVSELEREMSEGGVAQH